jgi:hypothetical protein
MGTVPSSTLIHTARQTRDGGSRQLYTPKTSTDRAARRRLAEDAASRTENAGILAVTRQHCGDSTPVQFTVRHALADIDIPDATAPHGDEMFLLLAAGNRDPRRAPEQRTPWLRRRHPLLPRRFTGSHQSPAGAGCRRSAGYTACAWASTHRCIGRTPSCAARTSYSSPSTDSAHRGVGTDDSVTRSDRDRRRPVEERTGGRRMTSVTTRS